MTAIAATTTNHHGGAGWAFVVVAVFILGMAVATAINPKLQWKMSRWQFKNPSAREPSARGLIAIRISSTLVAIVAVFFLITGIRQL